jgi:CubicO group peptidase (beta-lactamase class C family)
MMGFLRIILFGLMACIAQTARAAPYAHVGAELDELQANYQTPGLYVTITGPDHTLRTIARGMLHTGLPIAPYVRIGSITKTFNALLSLRLVASGHLSLDFGCAPRTDCPYNNPWESSQPITIAQLLEHTGGFTDLSAHEFAQDRPLSSHAAFSIDPSSRHVRWQPGRFTQYSNNSAAVLGWMLTAHAGIPYETLMRQYVFEPLGLDSATYALSPLVRKSLPPGYDRDGRTAIPYWHVLFPAFGGINLRADEMATVVRLMLNRGHHRNGVFLREAAIHRMQAPMTSEAARAGLHYGYALGLDQWYRRGVLFYGHDGDADGYLSRFGYSPAAGRGYFVLINAFQPDALRAAQRIIERAILEESGAVGVAITPAHPLSPASEARIVGRYRAVTRRSSDGSRRPRALTVLRDHDDLVTIDWRGTRERLVAVSDETFRRSDDGEATIISMVIDGALHLIGNDLGTYRKLNPTEH